jgi:hypothetical protein
MKNYYKHLGRIQNHRKVCITDIMTITGFMNNQEKLNHLVYYAKLTSDVKAIEYVQKKNINNQTGKEKKS